MASHALNDLTPVKHRTRKDRRVEAENFGKRQPRPLPKRQRTRAAIVAAALEEA